MAALLLRLPALNDEQEAFLQRWGAAQCRRFCIVAVRSTNPLRQRMVGAVLLRDPRSPWHLEYLLAQVLKNGQIGYDSGCLRRCSEQECLAELWTVAAANRFRRQFEEQWRAKRAQNVTTRRGEP